MEYPFSLEKNDSKIKLAEFLKHQANVEWGGYRLYDGNENHLQQIPDELSEFIFELIQYQRTKKAKIKKFLEIGFHIGFTNTILNKIFNFEEIVAIDTFDAIINGNSLRANLRFKNLTLICGNSTSDRVINLVKTLGPFDLIFIDGNHDYDIVKQDFENYKEMVSSDGIIAFHDIFSVNYLGVAKLWKEIIDSNKYESKTFFVNKFPMKAGIGILRNTVM